MHDTLYRRVADTAVWVYYIEQTVSRVYARYSQLFAAGAVIDQIMYLVILCGGYGITFEKKNRPQQGRCL
jgi:hypothetical protein